MRTAQTTATAADRGGPNVSAFLRGKKMSLIMLPRCGEKMRRVPASLFAARPRPQNPVSRGAAGSPPSPFLREGLTESATRFLTRRSKPPSVQTTRPASHPPQALMREIGDTPRHQHAAPPLEIGLFGITIGRRSAEAPASFRFHEEFHVPTVASHSLEIVDPCQDRTSPIA